MFVREVMVQNQVGLHARPATRFIRLTALRLREMQRV